MAWIFGRWINYKTMPEIKLTDDELNIVLMIKKKDLTYKKTKEFLKTFCFLLDKDFFVCKGGQKTALFDGEGQLRQIKTDQIDWKR